MPGIYEFDVFTSSHDDVMAGRLERVRSRVLISDTYTYAQAADLAAALAVGMHGGMPTRVLVRI